MKTIHVYAVSLGCAKNRVDTEHALGSLGLPIHLVSHLGRARMIFINTCGFILPAVQESVRTIVESIEHRSRLKKKPLLVVAGCLVGRYGAQALAEDLPEVDVWLPNMGEAHVGHLVFSLQRHTWGQCLAHALQYGVSQGADMDIALSTTPRHGRYLDPSQKSFAWLKISDGCRHACSFCTIPSIRGRHRSVPAEQLVYEAQDLLDRGIKELVLVAQDVTAWGEDVKQKRDLRHLLEQLLVLKGLHWLRLMYLYPAGLTDDLLHFIAEAGAPLVPYFDIPLQHAHPDILLKMGRPFAKDPRKVIERVHTRVPHAVLRTTFIVGFPGENETHFASLQDFVHETRFHHMGVFAYQAEEGTPAALMPEQVDDGVKQERRSQLMAIQQDISADILESFVGTQQKILVDCPHEEWPGLYRGRAWFQAPSEDGICYISGAGVEAGAMVTADIVDSTNYDLSALA